LLILLCSTKKETCYKWTATGSWCKDFRAGCWWVPTKAPQNSIDWRWICGGRPSPKEGKRGENTWFWSSSPRNREISTRRMGNCYFLHFYIIF